MSRKEDLESLIRKSYEIIREYEGNIPTSGRPEEKARGRQVIEEHWSYIGGYLREYRRLVEKNFPDDIAQIAAHFPSPPGRPPQPWVQPISKSSRLWIWIVGGVLGLLLVLVSGSFFGLRPGFRSLFMSTVTSTTMPAAIPHNTLTSTLMPTSEPPFDIVVTRGDGPSEVNPTLPILFPATKPITIEVQLPGAFPDHCDWNTQPKILPPEIKDCSLTFYPVTYSRTTVTVTVSTDKNVMTRILLFDPR